VHPLDLSKATKLKSLRSGSSVQWITTTLQTIKSKSLQRILIRPFGTPPEAIEEEVHQQWQDLDRLLVQFWTSHSIRPQIMQGAGKEWNGLRDRLPGLLPELTRRGLVDLFEPGISPPTV